jgi:beta-lactamase regulating signal transducer with metallopeptidase domain
MTAYREATLVLTAIANTLWIGCAAALLAWWVPRLFPKMNAATRYAVCWAVMVFAALLPVLGVAVVKRPVPAAPAVSPVERPPASVPEAAPATGVVEEAAAAKSAGEPFEPAEEPRPIFPVEIRTTGIAAWLVWAWALVAGAGLVRLGAEFRTVRRMRRGAAPAGEEPAARLARLLRDTDTRRKVRLALSDDVHGPVALGVTSPLILLPRELVEGLSGEELDNVVLHEIAHLRRYDDCARLTQRILETIFFFHPAVLWLGRRLDLEREIACDDWVIAVTGAPQKYASCLTHVAELSGFRRRWALATGAAETKSQLVRRVELMLDRNRNRNRTPHLSGAALWAAVVLAGAAMYAAAGAPAVLAFTDEGMEQGLAPAPPTPPMPASPSTPPAPPAFGTPPAAPVPPALRSGSPPPQPPAAPVAQIAAMTPPTPPAAAVPPAPAAPPRPPSEGHSRMRWIDNGRGMNLEIEGEVEFTDDDHDIRALSPNGRFAIEASSFNEKKRYEVRADAGGKLTRSYWLNGTKRPVEEARPWLAAAVPEILRETAIGAGPRIQRIARTGGTSSALREIGNIRSDHSRGVYITELVSRVSLNDGDLREVMRLVRGMQSDGDRARVLIAAGPKFLKPGTRPAYFEAVDSMNSDGDRRRVLQAAIQRDGVNAETLSLAARSAGRLSSDGDKAAVLVQATGSGLDAPEVRSAWFRAANTVNSDGDRAHALLGAIERSRSTATLADAARSAKMMSSDGDKARVLTRIAQEALNDAALRSAYFEAADSIASDGDKARTLSAALHTPALSAETALAAIRTATHIHSDGDKARVLAETASRLRTPEVERELRAAAKTINSDGDYRRVMAAIERTNPTI